MSVDHPQTGEAPSLASQMLALSTDAGRAEYYAEIARWQMETGRSPSQETIEKAIGYIDAALSEQLAAIMHHPKFLALEGSWRGLHHLVMNKDASTSSHLGAVASHKLWRVRSPSLRGTTTIKIKVINVHKRELFTDLKSAAEFDQSTAFQRIYEDVYGAPGGEPFGAMIGDYQFTNQADDLTLLSLMASVAAAAHCPFITGADPGLFGFKSFTELNNPLSLIKLFDAREFAEWNKLRESPDASYVAMTLPRVLARTPYGEQTVSAGQYCFHETPLDPSGHAKIFPHDQYCWMNAAYVYASRVTNAFARTNWCMAIVGKENGGAVEGLPMHYFMSDSGDLAVMCPTEVAISGRRDAEFSKLGFLPLCWYKNSADAVFFESQTLRKPKLDPASPKDQANEEISARLSYILALSRFAHYMKMMARDRLGSYMETSDCKTWLEKWISGYVLADPSPSPDMKAKYPLRGCNIEVRAIPEIRGAHSVSLSMRFSGPFGSDALVPMMTEIQI